MRPENLMIGDWLSLFQGNTDLSSCNVRVTFIGEYGEVGIEGCEEYTSANCNLLFPISLTPEILEQNGFKECTNGDWTNDNVDFILYRRKDGIFCIQNTNMTLPYVSSFQHVLRLCGINKEIEI